MTRRPGSIYFLTLAGSIILVAAVLALSYRLLAFRRTTRQDADADQARVHAELAVRYGLWYTRQQPAWRSNLNSGTWINPTTFGQASFSLAGIDDDGNLADDTSDNVTLTGQATVNGITRSVQATARNAPDELLQFAVAARGRIDIDNNACINGDITSNNSVAKTGSSAQINGAAQAVGSVNEKTNISGQITESAPEKTFPNSDNILQHYQNHATAIPYTIMLENVLLSPSSNPFGQTNPDGLYLINCSNRRINIRNCRIVGTLFLLSPGANSRVLGAMNWTPARPDYPAFIADSDFTFVVTADNLSEAALHTDFSLPSEPGHGSQNDSYPSAISGLLYSTGAITLDNHSELTGAVISHSAVSVSGNAYITHDPALFDSPPCGFRAYYLAALDGSWQETNAAPIIPKAGGAQTPQGKSRKF